MPTNITTDHVDNIRQHDIEHHKFVLIITTEDATTSRVIQRRLEDAITNLGSTAAVALTIDHKTQTVFDNQDW